MVQSSANLVPVTRGGIADLVQQLKGPRSEHLWVERDRYRTSAGEFVVDGDGNRIVEHTVRELVRVEHSGLMAELRDAVTAGIGINPAGGSSVHGRDPINSRALELYDRIELDISERYRDVVKEPLRLLPEDSLSKLVSVMLLDEDSDEHLVEIALWLRSIVAQIEVLFDPPRSRELLEPCPTCGESWALLVKDRKPLRVTALEVVYREDVETGYRHPLTINCRFEGRSWVGSSGASEYLRERSAFDARLKCSEV